MTCPLVRTLSPFLDGKGEGRHLDNSGGRDYIGVDGRVLLRFSQKVDIFSGSFLSPMVSRKCLILVRFDW